MPGRLLLVTPTLVAYRVFLAGLSRQLAELGWQVHLACSTSNYPADVVESGHVTRHEIDFPRGADPAQYYRAGQQLRTLVQQLQPSLVHAHFSAAILATAVAHQRDWPITIGTFQGLIHVLERGPRRWLYRLAERWSAARLDEIWVLTVGDRQALQGIPNVHQQQSPGFGADQERFDPRRYSAEDREQRRAHARIGPDDCLLVYVGRQTEFKGFPQTVRAAQQVVVRNPQVHFLFLGTRDPLHNDGLSAATRGWLEEHPQIHLVGWSDDVPAWLHAADGLVFPSQREGMSVGIMEALSMGLPVITTAARGCGELVRHEGNGLIVQPRDDSLIAAIERVANDKTLVATLARNALQERDRWDRRHYIAEQLAIYERLLATNGRGR